MRKRVQIAFAVLLVILAGVSAWLGLREREPVYEGKPLSYWVYEANGTSVPEARKAAQVLRQAGTNAMPTLLRMLRKRDSAFVDQLVALARKQHVVQVRHISSRYRNFVVPRAFVRLGADAKDAVPELIGIFDQHISEESQAGIADILSSIGPAAREAIPSLLRAATNQNPSVHVCVISALSAIHAKPESLVPLLTKCLSEPDAAVNRFAISGLQAFASEAQPAVPALVEFFSARRDGNFDKSCAGNALKAIDPDAAARVGWSVPVLAESLSNTNEGIRFYAASGLGDFGAEAREAVPALVGLLHDPDLFARIAATNALKAIDPEAAAQAGVK
jgi:hypothetical protein